jgi:hypothetical protein
MIFASDHFMTMWIVVAIGVAAALCASVAG